MAYLISPIGVVKDAQIIKSSGTTPAHKLLDATVLVSMMQCEFSPATVNGTDVESWTTVRFVWRLQ